ncbi:hypothetical protein [Flavonifractor sp. An91]|uniref:hypothetical protein n=1 Tax=Flavonifractor sp. An91 TaxID=1965665 RepID=UPI000B3972C1|nr:hypothetical protein [Flavonifractor sp. An91]OUN13332.1 hypothetical protein B5G42_04930 [Flavonifractor sp. An91]
MFKKKYKLNLNREEIDYIKIVFKNEDKLNLSCKEINGIGDVTIKTEKEEMMKAFKNKTRHFDSEYLLSVIILFMSFLNALFICSFTELDLFSAICIVFPISIIIVTLLFLAISWFFCRK